MKGEYWKANPMLPKGGKSLWRARKSGGTPELVANAWPVGERVAWSLMADATKCGSAESWTAVKAAVEEADKEIAGRQAKIPDVVKKALKERGR